jgi:hypothetical protein
MKTKNTAFAPFRFGICTTQAQCKELSRDYIHILSLPLAGASYFGDSETMHSVVNISDATDAAFCRAVRVESKIPIAII